MYIIILILGFQISALLYKKIVFRKLPTLQKLKLMVMNNALNTFKGIIVVFIFSLFILLGIFHTYETSQNYNDHNNKKSDVEFAQDEDSWIFIVLLSMVETVIQLSPFVGNPPLM